MSQDATTLFGGFKESSLTSDGGNGVTTPKKRNLEPSRAKTAPYEPSTLPRDIYHYLPPNGEPFALFGDPFAHMNYVKKQDGVIRASQYWLRGKMEDNNFTAREIALLTFLSRHRVATRNQIRSSIFELSDSDQKIRDFIKKMQRHGVLIAFNWVTPCRLPDKEDGEVQQKRFPQVYGLSPVAAKAALELLPYARIPRQFQFLPMQFVPGSAPSMNLFFSILIANEFYCRLNEMDRVVEWDTNARFELSHGYPFRPNAVIKTIKDENDFKYLWLEVIRPQENWYEDTSKRFRHMEMAISSLETEMRPEAVVILVDNISRISDIAELVEIYLPNIAVRYTTDERVLQKESDAFFYKYSKDTGARPAKIKHLTFDWDGLTASEYHHYMYLDYDEEDGEDDFDDDY